MRKRLVKMLTALVLAYLAVPAWAQAPSVQPLPEPTPLGNPSESPPVPSIVANPPMDEHDNNDCCCRPHGYWTVGGGIYYIQPAFDTNPAFLTSRTGGGTTFVHQTDFNHHTDVAPLAFLGYTGPGGLGIRAHWFNFRSSGQASGSLDAGSFVNDAGGFLGSAPPLTTASSANATSTLKVDVYDLEGTYTFHCGSWAMLTAAGVRYVHMNQDYSLAVNDAAGTNLASVSSSHNFNGAGPTFCLQGQRQLCSSCFSVYGSARASILFGSAHQVSAASGSVVTGPFEATSEQTDVLPIGELEVGGQWGKVCGHCRLFAQLGFVGQVWFGGGNAFSDSTSNFGFVGGVFRAGVNF